MTEALKPHILLASLYEGAGRPDDAEREWRRALAIDPRSEAALEGLTANFVKRRDYASVLHLLQDAPRTEKLSIELSRALGLLNDVPAAAEVLEQALKEHPDSIPLARAMIVVLVKKNNREDAINLARQVLQKHPGDVQMRIELLSLLVLTDHLDEAREVGPPLLEAAPNDPEVLFLNGLIRHQMGDNEGAAKLLEQAVAIQPEFSNSRYELGAVLVSLKQWAEAKVQLEKAMELGNSQPEVHLALAKALRGLGDTDRANLELAKYQEGKRDDESKMEAAGAMVQGDHAMEEGKSSEAAAKYRQAIELQPQVAVYYYKLSIALNRTGDTAGERKALDDAIRANPKFPGAQNALGYLLSRSGDADGAVEHFRAAVEAAPGWSEAWINLAAELAVTRRFSEARQAVARALELDPQNQEAKELRDQLARDPAAQQDHP